MKTQLHLNQIIMYLLAEWKQNKLKLGLDEKAYHDY